MGFLLIDIGTAIAALLGYSALLGLVRRRTPQQVGSRAYLRQPIHRR
jgi:hypothetical protein